MTHPTRGSTQGFELPGLTGFTFQLALHGSRMQLEARHGGQVWSTWMEPTQDRQHVADQLCRQPCCCLG
ncbi:MAG: hypothetical protein NTX18_10760 [Cyanobium sp. LacPavin_0818_WC50_MAG_67_9]|nr:hypothetical protein [Cyanobium sp. LacPavin_0818_WC50_MAG_67_9]